MARATSVKDRTDPKGSRNPISPSPISNIRCAIYTRKSSEEGLDQDFNSLDAQREACAAYVMSQRHEGWTLLPETYDDGGISGGHMNRAGLLRLLDDVKSGKVDVIVVYKVDRLTRSLSDFAKIVDVLDAAGASFVSITQSFNTTTSMGRLTLNVLLSFAQFEREVTGERIRDKIAASKKKGLWMGGLVPLGYEVQDRKLVVNEAEAQIIRHIFTRYLELGSVPMLVKELARDGTRSKQRIFKDGRTAGDCGFGRGALYDLLSNRLYLGEVVHKGMIYPGEHDAIIDRALWDQVQAKLADNRVNRHHQTNAQATSLLAGMIEDGHGRRMSPRHAVKANRHYRYYVSVDNDDTDTSSSTNVNPTLPRTTRIAAGDVETEIVGSLTALFSNQDQLIDALAMHASPADQRDQLQRAAASIATTLPSTPPSEVRALLIALDVRVVIAKQVIAATISKSAVAKHLGLGCTVDTNCKGNDASAEDRHVLKMSNRPMRSGHEIRLAIPPQQEGAPTSRNGGLVTLIVKAHQSRDALLGKPSAPVNITSMSHRHLTRMARLAYLAPDIITAILEGRQPKTLTARTLLRTDTLPLDWPSQRKMLGFG